MSSTQRAVDIFAGPGGWDLPARDLGLEVVGVEWDKNACATRAAAGLATIRADVACYPPERFHGFDGLIGSPPCPDFSRAGKGAGLTTVRGQLVWQPLYWARIIQPRWIALEQVPDVLPIWRQVALALEPLGYSTWTGLLSSERFGVPQTRERAVLMAHRDRVVTPPEPSHQEYVKGVAWGAGCEPGLFGGGLLPWVSMADALGTETNRVLVNRRDSEGWVANHGDRENRSVDAPAPTMTGEAFRWSWELSPGGSGYKDRHRRNRSLDEPAPTVAFGNDAAGWKWFLTRQVGATARSVDEPSPTLLAAGLAQGVQVWTDTEGPYAPGSTADTRRIEVEEAAVLQSFPADYPWQGSRTAQFQQIGNAIPPLMADAILSQLTRP